MRITIAKFLICTGLILMGLAWKLSAQSVYYVNTSYEADLLKVCNLSADGKLTYDGWYHSIDGIDGTARKFLDTLPSNQDVILYGISLGGVVSRRMTQLAQENGKNVTGYIAQSSPLSGDRLTNKNWALTATGLLGAYTILGADFTLMFSFLDILTTGFAGGIKSDFDSLIMKSKELDLNAQLFFSVLNEANNKDLSNLSSDEIINTISIPLIETLLGKKSTKDESGDAWKFLPDVLFDYQNNVKDLDPLGNFMCNILNSPCEMKKELSRTVKTKQPDGTKKTENKEIKRAFIVSKNGNLFETSAWGIVEPVLSIYVSLRETYYNYALSQWWAFPFWSLKSAAMNIPIATIEGLPKVWSYCVSGSSNFASQDCFVPVDDTFYGKHLGMEAPNLRNYNDRVFYCDETSHLDYLSGEVLENVKSIKGRTNPEIGKLSYTHQKEKFMEAYLYVR